MRLTTTFTIRMLLAGFLFLTGSSQAEAFDREPDANGKYDGIYDRPTYYPNWEQPTTWPNAMYYRCQVMQGQNGPVLENYEIAVIDEAGNIRECKRSISTQGHRCVLTIRGQEPEVFHFRIIYCGDKDNNYQDPIIYDVPDLTCSFKTNDEVGLGDPFLIYVPGRTYLFETATEAPEAEEDVDVTVVRTIKGGEWGTICLPFAMSSEQVQAAFGENVQLADFTGCDVTYTDETEETVKSINVKFENVTAVEANHPYIIKVENDMTEINADGVDIEAEEEPSVDCDPYPYQVQVGKNKYETHYWYNSFIGNYVNDFLVPNQTLFLSGGKFYYSTGKTKMMAFRGYFDFYEMLPEAAASSANTRIALSIDGEEATAIQFVTTEPQHAERTNGTLYDLQGRRVSQPSKGLYISNGHKYIIK